MSCSTGGYSQTRLHGPTESRHLPRATSEDIRSAPHWTKASSANTCQDSPGPVCQAPVACAILPTLLAGRLVAATPSGIRRQTSRLSESVASHSCQTCSQVLAKGTSRGRGTNPPWVMWWVVQKFRPLDHPPLGLPPGGLSVDAVRWEFVGRPPHCNEQSPCYDNQKWTQHSY